MATEKLPKAPEAEPQATAEGLQRLGGDILADYQDQIAEKTGEPIDLKALKENPNPDTFDNVVQRLVEAFGNLGDKVAGILALFGIKNGNEYISAAPRESAGASLDTRDLPPEAGASDESHEKKLSRTDWDHLQNAEIALARNKPWLEFIHQASLKHGIPESTIVAIIEMESNFDPNKHPIDPVTKKHDLRVMGLAQARKAAKQEYQKAGHPDADLMDPKIAIDFVAWYCVKLIYDVNWMIKNDENKTEKQNWKAAYAIEDEHNIANLWLAYNQGAEGYLRLRRYADKENASQRTEYENDLSKPQKRTRNGKFECELAMEYAKHVETVAKAYEALHDTENITLTYHPIVGGFSTTSGVAVREHPKKHKKHFHNGVDLAASLGTRVVAVKSGIVVTAESTEQEYNGRYVTIQHDDLSQTQYLHLDSVAIGTGQRVDAGQMLGTVGQTGSATGPHLHFIYKDKNGNYKNPFNALSKAPKAP